MKIYADADALADAAGRHFLEGFSRLPETSVRWCVALSGGRIAPKLFQSIVRQATGRRLAWEKVEFFFADDRWVPWCDEQSNYGVAQRYLFQPLNINPRSVHPLYLGRSIEFDAAQAQADLLRKAACTVDGNPILDAVILGMGEDGHIASLFPNAPKDVVDSRAVYLPVYAPKSPHQRITLTYGVLAVARDVLVVISGSGKEAALRESIQTNSNTPLGLLISRRRHTVIFTDFPLSS
ncbi:MAG: 6-phosphogluconolactonase [Verrucomicrobiae bacterium]|nr:6-phosphogluconolactonase [Verrucomicrobiae bacterium]